MLEVPPSVWSSVGDSKNSTTITTIENVAYCTPESMAATNNVDCTDQVSTVVNDPVITDKNIAYNVPGSLLCHAENAPQTYDDTSQLYPIDYNNFSLLRVRHAIHESRVHMEVDENPIMTDGKDEHVDHHVQVSTTDCL